MENLGIGHFERKHRTHLIFNDCGVFDNVHRKRSFTHTGTGGKHYQIGLLQSVRNLVEAGKARRNTAVSVLVFGKVFKLFTNQIQSVARPYVLNGGSIVHLRNGVNLLFRKLRAFSRVVARLCKLYNFACGAYQLSVGAVALYYIVVKHIVRRRRGNLRKLGNIGNPARLLQIAVAFKPVG